jgi:hypothetical protein
MVLVGVLPACGFPRLANIPSDGSDVDALMDSKTVDASAPVCFGAYMKICFDEASKVPTAPPQLPTGPLAEIDTNTSSLCDSNNDQQASYCVIVGGGFEISLGTKLRAYGTKPLVLLSPGAIAVHGTLDVSSTVVASVASNSKGRGAGAAAEVACVFGEAPNAARGHSGGYGGTFGGQGGSGQQLSGGGEAKGEPGSVSSFPATLRGGCPGGVGANEPGFGGQAGLGGGAVAIIAANITLAGVINASGAGGAGGPLLPRTGAGGGGSGGMIFFESTNIELFPSGRLFANGGGGGEGGSAAFAGQPGLTSVEPMEPAAGGITSNEGGNGGPGSAGGILAGADSIGQSSGDGGGGAGGGGAGFIHAPGISGAMIIAPPSTDPAAAN